MLELIRASKAPVVFLVANWPVVEQVRTRGKGLVLESSRFEETILKVRKMGKKIVIIGMIPDSHYHVEDCISARGALAFMKKCPATTRYKLPLEGSEFEKKRIRGRLHMRDVFADMMTNSTLISAGRKAKWLSFVDPYKSLCDEGTGECKVFHKGDPIYSDDHHLTREGSLLLQNEFRKALRDLL